MACATQPTRCSSAARCRQGSAPLLIVRTGGQTQFGEIARRLAMRPPETEFDRGIRRFGLMITRVIMALVLFVLLVNVAFHRNRCWSHSCSRLRLRSG